MQTYLSKNFLTLILLVACLTGCKADIEVTTYTYSVSAENRASVHVFVNGQYMGDTDKNGFLSLKLDSKKTQVLTAITDGAKGSIQLTEQDYLNKSVNIVLEEQDAYGFGELNISSIESKTLDSGFSDFDLSFVNNGRKINLRNSSYEVLLSTVSGEVDFTNDFHVVNGKLVPISFQSFKKKLLSKANTGKLTLSVYAEGGIPDLSYRGEKIFFINQYTINGKVSAPPSDGNVPTNNLEIVFSYLGNGKFVTKTVTNDAGEFSIKLPFGNWKFDAISKYNNLAFASKGSYLLDNNINLNINLLTVQDIQNGVPFFTISSFSSIKKSALKTSIVEKRQREKEESSYFISQKNIPAFRSAATHDWLTVVAGRQGQTISANKTISIPKGVQEIKLVYNASTAEYPTYVTKQSIYNDVWSISAFSGAIGFLFNEQRQVNSQLTQAPIWQSNGSTGDVENVIDVSKYTESGDFILTLIATARNVGDSILPTSVKAYVEYNNTQVNITNVSLNNEFSGQYFSLPAPSKRNFSQRTFDIAINTPSGFTESELVVAIEKMDGTVVQNILKTTNLNVSGGVISDVNVTNFRSTIGRIPSFHNYRYVFIVKATNDKDKTNVIESKPFYSDQYYALWEMPSTLARYGTRDSNRGGDGWSAKGTYEWLVNNADLVTEINDISGEHGRDIGHRTHKTGTDIDIFLFHMMVAGSLDRAGQATANYLALRNHVVSALQGNQTSLSEVESWVIESRSGLTQLSDLNSVSRLYYTAGRAYRNLPQGWGRILLETGRLEIQNSDTGQARVIDLGLSAWSENKVRYNNIHNNHAHITLDAVQLNNAP